ncbi:MAG: thioredoxin family protein [Flavobacteriales bacterium]|nr:thioredoxin family protein [Flavobacteriales bacterium]
MKKIFFATVILFSVSCQMNSSNSEVREKVQLKEVQDTEKLWFTDVDKALMASKNTGKSIFVFFTGKDWCSWCHKLDRQILVQEDFINYAKENLVLLELDFPKKKRVLPLKQIELARKFQIRSYPTVILMDAYKNEIGRTGYEAMSPLQYTEHIHSIIK